MPIIGLWSCPTELKRSSFWQKDTRTALTGYFTSCFRLGSIALPARLENENSLLVVTVVRAWGNGTLAFRSKFSLAHRSNSLSLFSVRPVICYATVFCFTNLGCIYEQRRVLLYSSALSLSRPHARKPNCVASVQQRRNWSLILRLG